MNMAHGDEALGIECRHHYGITTHDFVPGEEPVETVYRIMREKWHAPRGEDGGLRDGNHTWEAVPAKSTDGWSRIRIIKNDNSPRFPIKPWWVADGPGAFWFDQEFRIATRELIEREIADKLAWAERSRVAALREKPTNIGTKRATKAWSWIEIYQREAKFAATRWPQFRDGERTVWQERLHEGPNLGRRAA